MIVHVNNKYKPRGHEEAARNARAQETWRLLRRAFPNDYKIIDFESPGLPKVADLIDAGFRYGDSVLLTNSDSFLVRDVLGYLKNPCWSYRLNFWKPLRFWMSQEEAAIRGRLCVGSDLVFVTRDLWLEIRESLPDLFIGRQGWDSVYRWVIGRQIPPVVCHEAHVSYWYEHQEDDWNLWNRRECVRWAKLGGEWDALTAFWPELELWANQYLKP